MQEFEGILSTEQNHGESACSRVQSGSTSVVIPALFPPFGAGRWYALLCNLQSRGLTYSATFSAVKSGELKCSGQPSERGVEAHPDVMAGAWDPVVCALLALSPLPSSRARWRGVRLPLPGSEGPRSVRPNGAA